MKIRWIGLLGLLFLGPGLFASGIKGFIKNENNAPLAYATVFVQETQSGSATNENGYYEIPLPRGSYTITFQYLGYESVTKKIAIGGSYKEINLSLSPQSFDLNTVEIQDGRENPAYTIMRKAIAKATYHREQVDYYSAMVYMKGSGRMLDSPFFLRKMMEKEGIDSTSAFLGETVSKIEYNRPNDYKELVKKIRKQGNDNSTSPMAYIATSFYEPELVEVISPLSPRAFAFYKFDFQGSYIEDGIEVNKIKVIPRNRGEGVFEGYISIVENDWAIHSLDLQTYKLGIKINLKQLYKPILPSVWLPINHQFDIEGSFFGFDFVYDYYALVNDYEIRLNPDLEVQFDVIDEKIETPPPPKPRQETEALSGIKEKLEEGGELTRKELRKLMKEYQKDDRKKMEEPEVVSNYSQIIDSTAYTRDSSYWDSIRPIPLTKYEVKSYQKVDSIAIVEKVEKDSAQAKKEENESTFKIVHLLFGNTYKLGENDYLRLFGPITSSEINTVEGYAFNYPITYSHTYDTVSAVNIGIQPRFAFARDRVFSGKAFLKRNFGEKFKKKSLLLEGGRLTRQFNEENPISPLFNTFLTIFFERNFMKLYEKEYGLLRWNHQLNGNFSYTLKGEYAQRYTLSNNRTRAVVNWENRAFTPNQPVNAEDISTSFPKHQIMKVGFEAEWKPWLKYEVRNGIKSVINNSSPTLWGGFNKAFRDVLEADIDFLHLYAGAKQHIELGGGNRLSYKVEGGFFSGSGPIAFVDYKHFQGNQTWITTGDPVGGFLMLPYYQYSTRDEYLEAHAHYQFRTLALTQIPLFWMLGLKENLFAHYLYTPSSANYLEVGYGLDNIYKIFRLEVGVSFNEFSYRDFGVFIGISSQIGSSVNISGGEEENSLNIGF